MNARVAALLAALAMTCGLYQAGRALFYPKQGLDLAPNYAAARWHSEDPDAHPYDYEALSTFGRKIGLHGPAGPETPINDFAYAPWLLVVYTPLSKLPWGQARHLWFGLSALASVAAAGLAGAAVAPSVAGRRAWALGGIACACLYFPLFYGLMAGQANDFPLLGLAAGLYLLRHGKPVHAGISLAPAALWKVFPALLLVFLVVRREWRALAACMAAAAAVIALALPVTGLRLWTEWLAYLPSQKLSSAAAFRNQSIEGAILLLSSPASVAAPLFHSALLARTLTRLLQVAAIVLAGMTLRRSTSREGAHYPVQFGAILVVGVLLTPRAWDHYGVYLLPAFLACFAAAAATEAPPRVVVCVILGVAFGVWGLTLQLHQQYEALAHGWRAIFLPAKVYASFALLGVCAYLCTASCPATASPGHS